MKLQATLFLSFRLVRNLSEKEGFLTRFACRNDRIEEFTFGEFLICLFNAMESGNSQCFAELAVSAFCNCKVNMWVK